jgi:16S rRNA G966 N2-methylase RsmD
VREALFSTLKFVDAFEDGSTRVLDIFSGSGSIGLEALSRGEFEVRQCGGAAPPIPAMDDSECR